MPEVLGILRFSMVLKTNRGFPALVDQSYEDRCELIFAKERMEQRLHLLQTLLFPSLRAQTDFDFRLAVLITTNIPESYLRQLKRLLSGFPQAFIVPVPPSRMLRFGCKVALETAISPDAGRWATFRIDDDDALAADYIARVRSHLKKVNETSALTFNRGVEYSLQKDSEGVMTVDGRPFSGAGLALLAVDDLAAARFPTVYQLGPHRHVAQHLPTICDRGGPAFLRLLHESNVSNATSRPNARKLTEDEKIDLMGHRFPTINLENIEC
ncbi:putative rhamnosyl transferase [Rhodobacteraceae bacterium M385]|nr:putative rhamnosyl transferase [Rhodobacteraceae bacterium M385]